MPRKPKAPKRPPAPPPPAHVWALKVSRPWADWIAAESARLGVTRAALLDEGLLELARTGRVSEPPARARPHGTNGHGEPGKL